MNPDTLTLAIIGHVVGDFLLQNHWMQAKRQPGKAGERAATFHALIWAVCVCVFAGWLTWDAFVFLFWTHFLQDHTQFVARWMRLIRQTPPEQWPAGPFYVDQAWHILTLWAAWRFIA